MKRDYLKDYYRLQKDVNDEMFNVYNELAKKFGSHPLVMGKDFEDGTPVVHDPWIAVDVQIGLKIDGYYTKVNHLIHDKRHGFNNVIIKGFQIIKGKYRMKEFNQFSMEEKIEILKKLKETYDEVLSDSLVIS